MKKLLAFILCLFGIFLFACAKEVPVPTVSDPVTFVESDTQEPSEEPDPVPAEPPAPDPTQTTTTIPTTTTAPHVHQWKLASLQEPSCDREGVHSYRCDCGLTKNEGIPTIPHSFASQGCEQYALCSRCGASGEYLSHQFEKNRCTLCELTVTSPVFVRNCQLHFSDTEDVLKQKLGTPTEILREGALTSLVYADDLKKLTVIQVQSYGLWGVFTMDPSAFFQADDKIVRAEGFYGLPDTGHSDTSYYNLPAMRVYGYRDTLGSGAYYGLFGHRTNGYQYDFLLNSQIRQDYSVQSRLSFYFVNALRALHGIAPLRWSATASQVCVSYSEKMAAENFFDHDGLYGNRLREAGIIWRSCGENLSLGYSSAYFVCDAYYNCTEHRNNILNGEFTHAGFGYALQSDEYGPMQVLGTQIFYS